MPTNEQRRGRAARALIQYEDGEDLRACIVDLLTDLRHYACELGIDYAAADCMAAMHFEAESEDENGESV